MKKLARSNLYSEIRRKECEQINFEKERSSVKKDDSKFENILAHILQMFEDNCNRIKEAKFNLL